MSALNVSVAGWLRSRGPREMWREASRRPQVLAPVISTLVVLLARHGPDWPAQEFRANLARDVGLTARNNQWYGGHPLPSYSLLYPAVAALLGAELTAVLAAVGSSWLVTRLVPPIDAGRRRFGVAVVMGVGGNVFLGQLPFLLGLFFGLAALMKVRKEPVGAENVIRGLTSHFNGLRNGDDRVVRVPSIRLLLVLRISSWLQLSRREESWKPPRSCCCVTS